MNFLPIASGGMMIAVLSISQCLAVGALGLAPLGPGAVTAGVAAAFVTAIVGGLITTLVLRAPGEVSQPVTSIGVLYAALCTELVLRNAGSPDALGVIAALSLAVVLMGLLQIAAGWARIGEALRYLPLPVSAGFVTGIGILIIAGQLAPLLGLEGRIFRYDWSQIQSQFKPAVLVVGMATVATICLVPHVTSRIQPLLAGLFVGTLTHHLLAAMWGADSVGSVLGSVTPAESIGTTIAGVWERITSTWLVDTSLLVLPYSASFALQGIMSAATTSAAVANITGIRAKVNQRLVVQGIANIACGLLAGMPLAMSPSQSLPAARMAEINRWVPAASRVVMLIAILIVGQYLTVLPVVVLAGILLVNGFNLIDRWTRGLMLQVVRNRNSRTEIVWNLGLVLLVAGSFCFAGVPTALLVGSVLAAIMLAVALSRASRFDALGGPSASSVRVWPAEKAQWLVSRRSAIRILRPSGGLFFGTADNLRAQLDATDATVRYCVIDCSRLTVFDATGCQAITSGAKALATRKVVTILAGINASNARDAALVDLGLTTPAAATHWFPDLDRALEWVESALIVEQWRDAKTDAPVDFAHTDLARGLDAEGLAILLAHCVPHNHHAGSVLFERSSAGDALYIIVSGLFEIRAAANTNDGTSRRLAALGPGCIFGEVALFHEGARTADALCVASGQLYELRSAALAALETTALPVYAKVTANLNRHLATRLIVSTDRAQ